MDDTKPTNPKDILGAERVPMHLFPSTAVALGAMVLLSGALKYGPYNWRTAGIRMTIYIDAIQRHLAAYANGEDLDPESGQPHIAHVLACAAILLDAEVVDQCIDDRPTGAYVYGLLQELIPDARARLALRGEDG